MEDDQGLVNVVDSIYRYVCPNCLRTFLSEVLDDPFCWKCGQALEQVPK